MRACRGASIVALALITIVVAACGSVADRSASPTIPSSPAPSATTSPGRPLVIDTDVGPDDLMAIAYVLARPDLDVRAITVSGTGLARCEDGVRLVGGLAARLGHPDIDVACGRETPLRGSHAFPDPWRDGIGSLVVDLPPAGKASGETALALLDRAAEDAGGALELLLLGPHTTIAEAMLADPSLAELIERITIMGGAVRAPGNVSMPGTPLEGINAEWNLYVDPYAAQVVLDSGRPITLVPLDATDDVLVTPAFARRLAPNRDAEPARFVYELVTRNAGALVGASFWDQLAAVTLVEPAVVELRDSPISVDVSEGRSSGATVVDPDGRSVTVAVSADAAAFEQEFIATLNGGRPVAPIPEPSVVFDVTFDGTSCTVDGPGSIGPTWVGLSLDNRSDLRAAVALVAFDVEDGWERLEADLREPLLEIPRYLRVLLVAESEPGTPSAADGPVDPGPHGIACTWLVEESNGDVTQRAMLGAPVEVEP